jgi:hypothetical protein
LSVSCLWAAACDKETESKATSDTHTTTNTETDTQEAPDTNPETAADTTTTSTADTQETPDTDTADTQDSADTTEPPLVIPSACGADRPEALVACVTEARYRDDLTFIARPRSPGIEHWQAVQDLCAQALTDAGFAIERHSYGTGVNVIGTRTGTTKPNEWVILSAHYDSVEACDGADDNGSGVAGVLEMARVLSQAELERTLVVACWDEEEGGLIGSRAYADRLAAQQPQPTIIAGYVLEMIGFESQEPGSQEIPAGFELLFPDAIQQVAANEDRGDFIAVIHDVQSRSSAKNILRYGQALGLPVVTLAVADALKNEPIANDLRRSDHAAFWRHDMAAMMLTDTANFRNPHYHCGDGEDALASIRFEFALKNVRAFVGAAATDLGVR